MTPSSTLTMTQQVHDQIVRHLFPGDGKEAATVLVCTRAAGARLRLLVRDVVLVPHETCSRRTEVLLTWPSAYIEQAIDLAELGQLSLVLLHSHPGGMPEFSTLDDRSDQELIPSIFQACGSLHGTAVMLPNGVVFGRLYTPEMKVTPIDLVSVVGPDLKFWWHKDRNRPATRPMAFTSQMTEELGGLTACVIGISGTGSIAAEQLCRLGFGRVIVIDHDKVEPKNLNRILNTVKCDADKSLQKVAVFADRANQYREIPYVLPVDADILTRKAVLAAAQADVLFCCVDTLRARSVADLLGKVFLLPLFDVGVAIPTRLTGRGERAVDEATGRIDYVHPAGSSLIDRGIYTPAALAAEALAEADPEAHADQVRRGYIDGVPEQAPAVIALNMRAASACVMELIARAYPFRHECNTRYARTRFMLAECVEEYTAEEEFTASSSPHLARGDEQPLLGMPVLSEGDDE
ncbi:MAG: ThiF family adenylyltransferase [Acidobacteriaceae bacterium]